MNDGPQPSLERTQSIQKAPEVNPFTPETNQLQPTTEKTGFFKRIRGIISKNQPTEALLAIKHLNPENGPRTSPGESSQPPTPNENSPNLETTHKAKASIQESSLEVNGPRVEPGIASERFRRLREELQTHETSIKKGMEEYSVPSDEAMSAPSNTETGYLGEKLKILKPEEIKFRDEILLPIMISSTEEGLALARSLIVAPLREPNASEQILQYYAAQSGFDRVRNGFNQTLDAATSSESEELNNITMSLAYEIGFNQMPIFALAGGEPRKVREIKQIYDSAPQDKNQESQYTRDQLLTALRTGLKLDVANSSIIAAQAAVVADRFEGK